MQPYHCLIDSLFLIERFYNVKKTKKKQKKTNKPKKTNGFFDQKKPKKPLKKPNQKNRFKKTDQPWVWNLSTGLGVTDILYKFDVNEICAYFNKINRIFKEAIQLYN